MNKITHIQSRRDAAARSQRRVQYLLQWDDLTYGNMKFKAGLRYLAYYLRGDEDSIKLLSYNRIFWQWWKNHWTIREEAWLEDAEKLEKLQLGVRRNSYRVIHNPAALANEIHPNAVVLDDSYAQMISELNANLTKQAAL